MKLFHLLVILGMGYTGLVQADIYKRVDSSGHVTYSSEPLKGGKKLELKKLPVVPGARSSERSTPEDFPRVDTQTQQRRDTTRRLILEDELATETKLLDTARKELQDLENTTVKLVNQAGIPFRDALLHEEKIKAAKDSVTVHEQNIKALQTEISNLK